MLRDKITREPSIVKQTICKRIWRPRQEQRTSTTRHYNACVDISSTQKKKKRRRKKKEKEKVPKLDTAQLDHRSQGSRLGDWYVHFRVSAERWKGSGDRGEDRVINPQPRFEVGETSGLGGSYVPKSRDRIQRPGSIRVSRCLSSAFHAASSRQKRSRSTASRHATKPNASPIAIARGRISFPKREGR